MTKHESHIVLLLLALIAAGVLGYQFVNGNDGESTSYWTEIFTQTSVELPLQKHDSPREIISPVDYDINSRHDKPILREKNRFQNLINDRYNQVLPGEAENEPDDIDSAIDKEVSW